MLRVLRMYLSCVTQFVLLHSQHESGKRSPLLHWISNEFKVRIQVSVLLRAVWRADEWKGERGLGLWMETSAGGTRKKWWRTDSNSLTHNQKHKHDTYTHTNAQANTRTVTRASMHTHTYTGTRAHTHTLWNKQTLSHTHVYIHTCPHTWFVLLHSENKQNEGQ